jgi:carnosine N-methyltransferase
MRPREIDLELTYARSYRKTSHMQVTHRRRQAFYALPESHWTKLAASPINYLETLDNVDNAIDANADIAELIALHAMEYFLGPGGPFTDFPLSETGEVEEMPVPEIHHAKNWCTPSRLAFERHKRRLNIRITPNDVDKARSTIKQFYRDWSAEGDVERQACYGPVMQAIATEFVNTPPQERYKHKILVPGAGLGRLLVEIVREGYTGEGNEISYHQLMGSYFVLNKVSSGQEFPLFPWALGFSNHVSRAYHLERVIIPDTYLVNSTEGLQNSPVPMSQRMGMAAADFCSAYRSDENREDFDAVVSVFFIDTAPNPVRYIEAVHNCLKQGGIWVNHGPLLWHFEGAPTPAETEERTDNVNDPNSSDKGIGEPGSVELTDEEVRILVENVGFTIERHVWGQHATGYMQNPNSMLMYAYRPSFWIARKK